jgi:hypothetical protein
MQAWPWRKNESDLLFGPEHWQRLLAQVQERSDPARTLARNRRAERLWQEGYVAWQDGNREQAELRFREAVLEEPGLADGYLALLAVAGADERSQIIQALAHCADDVRSYQRRFGLYLDSGYYPLFFERVLIANADDCRLLYARHLLELDELEAATLWASRCRQGDSRTQAILGKIALAERRYERAIELLQKVAADPQLEADSQLGIGIALEEIGLLEGACSAFEQSAHLASTTEARRYARYRLARAHGALGRDSEARRILEQLYAEDVGYLDVASLLGLRAHTEADDSDPFAALVAELESGRVATDPRIADNRQ